MAGKQERRFLQSNTSPRANIFPLDIVLLHNSHISKAYNEFFDATSLTEAYLQFIINMEHLGISAQILDLRDKIENALIETKKLTYKGGFLLEDYESLTRDSVTFANVTGQTGTWKPGNSYSRDFSLAKLRETKIKLESFCNLAFDIESKNAADHRTLQQQFDRWEYQTLQISWLGPYNRFETVISLLRCTNLDKTELSADQVELGVHLFEKGENFMENESYQSAFRFFAELIRRYPGLSLAYYKCGLCLLEMSILSTEQTISQMRNYLFQEALHFFRCAASIEPNNRHLLGNIDFALRLRTGMEVNLSGEMLPSIYRDNVLFPKALSDSVVFSRLDRRLKKTPHEFFDTE